MDGLKKVLEIMSRLENAQTDEERKAIMTELMDSTPLDTMFNPIWGMIMEATVRADFPQLAVSMVEILIPFVKMASQKLSLDETRNMKSHIASVMMKMENSEMKIIHASSSKEGGIGGITDLLREKAKTTMH